MRSVATRRAVLGATLAGAGIFALGRYSMSDGGYEGVLAEMSRPLPEVPDVAELIRYATLAANGHNTQPWKFGIDQGSIAIVPDFSRRTPVVDPDDHHLYASLGCAAENLHIASRSRGMSGEISFAEDRDGHVLVDLAPGTRDETPLLAAIPRRQCTRAVYDGTAISAAGMARLEAATRIGGVEAIFLTDRARTEKILSLVIAGNSRQMDNPAFIEELKSWVRFNKREAARTRDGLFSAGSGNPVLPTWIGSIMYDLAYSKEEENRKYADQIRSSAGVVIFVAPTNDRAGWVSAGRACQRFALQATADGLKVAFINQTVEDLQARRDLQMLLGLGSKRPNLVMRFGHGPEMPRSLRRDPPLVA